MWWLWIIIVLLVLCAAATVGIFVFTFYNPPKLRKDDYFSTSYIASGETMYSMSLPER